MTRILQQAFDEALTLSDEEQDALGKWLLEDVLAEKQWTELFGRSQDTLSRLAANAIDEHRRGQTQPLECDAP